MDFLQKLKETESKLKNGIGLLNSPKTNFYKEYIESNTLSSSLPELFKIGNLLHPNGMSFPALIPLKDIKGLAFELNDTNREEIHLCIQHIALQIIHQLNPKLCKITVIDPKKMGSNFRFIRKLSRANVGELIYDDEGIKKSINNHFDKSISIINECLIHYPHLDAYNEKTGGEQPYRFIFIADFPYGFKDCIDKLNTLIHNNQEAGVFFFMTHDKSIDLGMRQGKVDEILSQLTVLNEYGDPANDLYKIKNIVNSKFYNENFTLQLDRRDLNPDNLDKIIGERAAFSKSQIKDDLGGGLRIPIGKVAGQTHYFTIGHETDNYHGIIGGQPGKGKTVLLNNIIARGIESYSPDELRFILLDCAGVGFQEFKESNHVQVMRSSSNVEECVEVIKAIEEELNNREALFREAKVAELKDYLKKTGNVMPRILCLIDEFHVLFTGSSRKGAYVETILVERVIRIGRKFGVHLIVSTQSLGGGVRRSILDNIPLRIALGMTPDQSAGFLGLKNEEAGNLDRGVAIYNNQNGASRANKTVRVNYIDFETVERIVNSANNNYAEFETFEQKIF